MPPPLPPPRTGWKEPTANLLSVWVALFLADASLSLLDDTLILFFGVHALGELRGLLALMVILSSLLLYLLMGITPIIPKRFFVPLTLFPIMAMILPLPLLIYDFDRMQQSAWV